MFDILIATAGLFLLMIRMRGSVGLSIDKALSLTARDQCGRVSIIVPARNEALNILPLLQSLEQLSPPPLEVIVVDDESTDGTGEIVQNFASQSSLPIKLISGKEKPRPTSSDNWNGKSWACHQGQAAAQGEFLLFTDADTEHHADSLYEAMAYRTQHQLGLLSCLPYHQGTTLWESLLGPFHVWLLAMTNPYGTPKPHRLYAIGQYLLFERKTYQGIGGHQAVRGELVEDIPLAQAVVKAHLRGDNNQDIKPYGVYTQKPLYKVRMYPSFGDFFRGWRRNFRAGMEMTSPWLVLDAVLMFAAVTGAGHAWDQLGPFLIATLTVIYLMWIQRRLGRFSPWGPLLFPLSLTVFCVISIAALIDKTFGLQQHWKGRVFRHDALRL